jgi:hypothetical protein
MGAQRLREKRNVPRQKEDAPVTGLTALNFRGEIGANQVQIVETNYNVAPRRIVIVLDSSGSMGDPHVAG